MAEFDPYLKWLGIRDQQRPVNHYRLLGLELYESDPEVISAAADRQMTHVRTYQNGPHGDLSQQILNELSRARRCLVTAHKKAAYDAELRTSLAQMPMATAQTAPKTSRKSPVPTVQPVMTADGGSVPKPKDDLVIRSDPNARAKTLRRESKQLMWSLLGWISGGIAAVGVAAWLIGSGILGTNSNNNELAQNSSNTSTTTATTPPENGTSTTGQTTSQNPKQPNGSGSSNTATSSTTNSTENPTTNVTPTNNVTAPTPRQPWAAEIIAKLPDPATGRPEIYESIQKSIVAGEFSKHGVKPTSGSSSRGVNGIPGEASLLVGMIATTNRFHCIQSIQPVFHDSKQGFLGPVVGNEDVHKYAIVARPGYAVGGFVCSILNPIQCFRLQFMKIRDGKLDPSDAYLSPWYGIERGPVSRVENPDGAPVLGVFGLASPVGEVAEFGLVTRKLEPAASTKAPNDNSFFAETKPKTTPPLKAPESLPETPIDIAPESNELVKAAIPSKEQQEMALQRLSRIYPNLATSTARYRVLRDVQRLIDDAEDSTDDPASQYIMLMRANQIAITMGEPGVAISALDQMDTFFEIEYWDLAYNTLSNATDSSGFSSTGLRDFNASTRRLVDKTIKEEEFDEALKLVRLGEKVSSKAKDTEGRDSYASERKVVQEYVRLHKKYVTAKTTLELNSNDAGANLDVGNYLFVVQNDAKNALKHWALSDDARLKELAELESANGGSPEDQANRGLLWKKLGNSNRTKFDRLCLEQADKLLSRIVTRVSGKLGKEVLDALTELTKKLDR